MLDYLKKYFKADSDGNETGTTFEEFVGAVTADSGIKLYNLSDGGYVGKDKLDAKIAEIAELKRQLEAANLEIKSYKDMDVEGIKESAKKWQEKYKEETKALEDKLKAQEYEFQVKELAAGLNFSSTSAKKAFLSDLLENQLTVKDGKILGFDDFVAEYRKTDPGAFVVEEPEQKEAPKPKFSEQTTTSSKKKLTLQEMMSMANEGKDISAFFN
jgi:hypothetical protein